MSIAPDPTPQNAPDAQSEPGTWLPEVYDELRRLAGFYLGRERANHTLQPTALVHEAFVKLTEQASAHWNDETHFRAVAANAMRQILVDHARARGASKRGGGWLRVTLSDAARAEGLSDLDMLALEESLEALGELSTRRARVVELRFFGGLTCAEIARVNDVSIKTVEADWYLARAWLRQRMVQGDDV